MESLEEGKKLRERELELSTAGADQSDKRKHTAFRLSQLKMFVNM
jgi:hypothetical protein